MSNLEQAAPAPPLESVDWKSENGMELRDYLAAKAMQGMLAACTGWSESQQERLAKCSYSMADEMLKARGQ
jgi:hypothetical protein